jgi:hypothetical protein
MKKILIVVLALMFMISSVAFAATYLLGTDPHPGTGNKWRTIWAYTASTPSGLMNATGATTAFGVSPGCDTAKIKFDSITGTNIMNIAVQVADYFGPEFGSSAPSDSLFTNAIGTTSAPWHQVDPSDTDTHKFDFSQREFEIWRLNCLVGCDLTNSIGTAWGDCWMAGTGGK